MRAGIKNVTLRALVAVGVPWIALGATEGCGSVVVDPPDVEDDDQNACEGGGEAPCTVPENTDAVSQPEDCSITDADDECPPDEPPTPDDSCARWMTHTCGANMECERIPQCVDALEHNKTGDQTACAAAFENGSSPPACDDAHMGCNTLLVKTCGATVGWCDDSPGCVGATLLAEFRPSDCANALGNETSYPSCVESKCTRLVREVCGTGLDVEKPGTCEDAPGCAPARLLAFPDDNSTGDEVSCATALSDSVLFPDCPP